jgi:hypothetical protein
MDIFHAETRRCNSELLLEVEDTTFSLDKTVDLPIDYSVSWNEDTQIGEILAEVNLIDDFSIGSYSISLYKGYTLDPNSNNDKSLVSFLKCYREKNVCD